MTPERFAGCLLGLALGDGLGAPFEGLPADHVFWMLGPVHELLARPDPRRLRTTDDTRMTIGVAEALVADGRIVPETLLARFVAGYDPDRGYGQGARRLLEGVRDGGDADELAESLFPGGSYGNGAAMRVAPVGLLFSRDTPRLLAEAEASARVTHRHPLGIEGAKLMALAVGIASRGPPFDRKAFFGELLEHAASEEFSWQLRAARRLRRGHSVAFLGNSLPAHRSVTTALAIFAASPNSYEGAITAAIALGDDTDTLAAMAGALIGTHLGEAALPPAWAARMEEGRWGATYIRELAERLWARFEADYRSVANS